MRSGSTPLASSQLQASIDVFPPPRTVYPVGAEATVARPPTGTIEASGSTPKLGRWVAGTDDSALSASMAGQALPPLTSGSTHSSD